MTVPNDGEVTEEPEAQAEQPQEFDFGPHIIVFKDDDGEVQIATKGGQFHPKEIVLTLEVVIAKLGLLEFEYMMQAQQARAEEEKKAAIRRKLLGE